MMTIIIIWLIHFDWLDIEFDEKKISSSSSIAHDYQYGDNNNLYNVIINKPMNDIYIHEWANRTKGFDLIFRSSSSSSSKYSNESMKNQKKRDEWMGWIIKKNITTTTTRKRKT